MRTLALLALLLCAPLLARASEGDGADAAFAALRHHVIVSEILIAPLDGFSSSQAMLVALRRLACSQVHASDGFWRLHLVAFMDPPPDTAEVRAVLTDVTEPAHRREVKVFELDTEPGAHELAVNDLVLTEDMGFQPGHEYELAVTQGADEPRGGKSAVLARGVVTLK